MKYLIKRNDFLRGAKRLDEKSEFLRDAKISGNRLYQDLIKEAGNSGPMENDIGWNDSLVGRFINHLVRKAKVANNLRRIKPLIVRLEGEFDRIAAEGFAYKLDDEQKKLYQKTILYSFFFELKEAVKNGSETIAIINLTKSAIENIKAIKDDMLDDRTKELLTKELEMFLSFLEQFEEEEESQSPDVETMIENLRALYNILANYKKVNIAKKDAELKVKNTYITNGGETIESIQKDKNINTKNLTLAEIVAKNENLPEVKAAFDDAAKNNITKEKAVLPEKLSLVLESLVAVNESNDPKERHLSEAFAKLKSAIAALVDTKDGKLPIDIEFVGELIKNHKEGENEKLIVALYDNINKYLVGDKKQTIQEKDPLYKESYGYLMPISLKSPKGGKIEVVAEKIARFAKRALQFDGKDLYDGLKELRDPLKKFVETMKELMKNPITNVKPELPKKNEGNSSMLKFDRFMSYIKEADEAEASDPRSAMTTAEKIEDYFDKKCLTVKEFTMEKTEFEKVRTNFEKIEKDKDGFVIDGYDPLIEILKLFNRAYKLYMSQYISKRTNFNPEGGIGVSTGAEYTSFGGGGNKGPFRNNKIFDTWENAVLDIMKNRKYQFIFDKKTKLRVGDEIRPNGGASLRKFMTDMMDGDALYKDGTMQGAQAKLLDKYFGAPDSEAAQSIQKNGTDFENDNKGNAEISKAVLENAIKVKSTKAESAQTIGGSSAKEPTKNAILAIKGKDSNGKSAIRYFFIAEKDTRNVYMQCSEGFGDFNGYINNISYGAKVEFLNGDLDILRTKTEKVYYTKVEIAKFEELLLKGGQISIGRLDNEGKEGTENIAIEAAYWITKEKDGKQIVFDLIQPIKGEDTANDAKKKQLKAAIEKEKNNPTIVNLINTRNNVVIKRAI